MNKYLLNVINKNYVIFHCSGENKVESYKHIGYIIHNVRKIKWTKQKISLFLDCSGKTEVESVNHKGYLIYKMLFLKTVWSFIFFS